MIMRFIVRGRIFIFKIILRLSLIMLVCTVFAVVLLRWLPPPTTSFVLQDSWNYFWNQRPAKVQFEWVTWDKISPYMALAVIAAEDQRFVDHDGFDFEAIASALQDRIKGEKLRGASTISQQVAKNLFLWRGKSFLRKGLEAYFTMLIELFWTKQRILEVYVNTVELGHGIYGVAAASHVYYHKSPSSISPAEAALLAAVLPSPKRWRVNQPSAYVRGRQSHILRQMRMLGGLKFIKLLQRTDPNTG